METSIWGSKVHRTFQTEVINDPFLNLLLLFTFPGSLNFPWLRASAPNLFIFARYVSLNVITSNLFILLSPGKSPLPEADDDRNWPQLRFSLSQILSSLFDFLRFYAFLSLSSQICVSPFRGSLWLLQTFYGYPLLLGWLKGEIFFALCCVA